MSVSVGLKKGCLALLFIVLAVAIVPAFAHGQKSQNATRGNTIQSNKTQNNTITVSGETINTTNLSSILSQLSAYYNEFLKLLSSQTNASQLSNTLKAVNSSLNSNQVQNSIISTKQSLNKTENATQASLPQIQSLSSSLSSLGGQLGSLSSQLLGIVSQIFAKATKS
jgi:hypothetical protein